MSLQAGEGGLADGLGPDQSEGRFRWAVRHGCDGLVSVCELTTGYWSRYHASRLVFQGEWLRTGDTYVLDADGYYTCLGRTGDMLKASGMWVAPAEVEARLHAHQAVSEAVVVVGRGR